MNPTPNHKQVNMYLTVQQHIGYVRETVGIELVLLTSSEKKVNEESLVKGT